ncbi:hypothetical protein C6P46_001707 [Rhodotorula mucilaginosa]|uniref:Uncharacterized protein n=1 Tax=Rhodotorula mucilaginosa TaxID=5537 RepID=A0A9P6W496_RHOMI|nr:hypothetical protein C6P46_001707 [Rhodotorula mucilaginosa]
MRRSDEWERRGTGRAAATIVQSARRKTGGVSAPGNRRREEIARPEKDVPAVGGPQERGESCPDEAVEQNESRGESEISWDAFSCKEALRRDSGEGAPGGSERRSSAAGWA